MKIFTKLEQQLLNDYQTDFPLCTTPFASIALTLHTTEIDILTTYQNLQQAQYISRIGAIVNHKTIGASTLAAMAIPADQLDTVAAFISALPEVNHNYAREHFFNLWFVITATSPAQVQKTLHHIQKTWSYPLLDLPMEKAYHIDLGFNLWN